MLLEEIKEDQNKWKDLPCPWIGRENIVKRQCKIVILPKLIYRFSANPIKSPAGHFVAIDWLILNLVWKCKGPSIVKTILMKNIFFPEFSNLF